MEEEAYSRPALVTCRLFRAVKKPIFNITYENIAATITKAIRVIAVIEPENAFSSIKVFINSFS